MVSEICKFKFHFHYMLSVILESTNDGVFLIPVYSIFICNFSWLLNKPAPPPVLQNQSHQHFLGPCVINFLLITLHFLIHSFNLFISIGLLSKSVCKHSWVFSILNTILQALHLPCSPFWEIKEGVLWRIYNFLKLVLCLNGL